jgi:hypothetical protein
MRQDVLLVNRAAYYIPLGHCKCTGKCNKVIINSNQEVREIELTAQGIIDYA